MTRVLISDFGPAPDKITGISTYLWCILRALLKEQSFKYALATNRAPQNVPDDIKASIEAVVYRRPVTNETIAMVSNSFQLPKIARRNGCSAIMHVQPASMLFGSIPSVVVVHDMYRVTNPELFKASQKIQWRFIVARGFKRSSQIIAVSHATASAFSKAYPKIAHKLNVVHEASPIDDSSICSADAPAPYILYVANITANKGVDQLISALGILANKGLSMKVLHIGRDDHNILAKSMQGLPIDIVSQSGISEAALINAFRNAVLYVNTSVVEGFCLPILEAQTFGIPVVCSDIPVLREVAGAGAVFFTPGICEELASAIQRLLYDDSERSRLSVLALENAARFSWMRAARETEAIISTAIGQ